jgi:hypothetical protein
MPLVATAGSANIEDGIYPGTILSLVETPATANSPKPEPFLRWTIHVWATADGVEMIANSSTRFSPKSKTRLWVESILDRRFETGETFDYEAFCPRDCQVTVRRDESGFSRIKAITGVPKRPVGRVAAPAPAAAPAAPDGVTV